MTAPDAQPSSVRTRAPRAYAWLVTVITCGGLLIAIIGFIGSYSAVQQLAAEKGFGAFAHLYPIGVDAGIVVLLALDLLLSWIRIPFPLLRQAAWLLTTATIAFNAASAWPDPLGVSMHAVIPVLFVVTVEAARHAVGRTADITADRYMEGVRPARWLLAFPSTFRLWRRMKLFELRDYERVVKLEQDRLVYQARLEAQYGKAWRRTAPLEARMPLRLAKYGVPLDANKSVLSSEPGSAALPPAAEEPQQVAAAEEKEADAATAGSTKRPAKPSEVDEQTDEEDIPAPPLPPPADGKAAVQSAYDGLPLTDQSNTSARKLAQRLAPQLGLKENTVRVYITTLRKERRLPVAVTQPAEPASEPPDPPSQAPDAHPHIERERAP